MTPSLFGDKNTKNVVLEKSYKEYMEGFTDVVTGEARRGFVDVVTELEQRFPDPSAIEKESDKKPLRNSLVSIYALRTCCKTTTSLPA